MATIEITEPCARFLLEHYDLVLLHNIMMKSVVSTDDGPTDDRVVSNTLSEHFGILSEMCYARLVDNYLTYFSEIIAEIFTKTPKMLKSEEKVAVEEILLYDDMNDLLSAIAERKVISLTMSGISSLAVHIQKHFAIELFPTEADLSAVNEIIEIRNIITHNRGVVNRRFVKNVSRHQVANASHYTTIIAGYRIFPGVDTSSWASSILHQSILRFDALVAKKFHLTTLEAEMSELQARIVDSPLMTRISQGCQTDHKTEL